MTEQENKNVVMRFNREFLEQGNAEVLKDLVVENFINHTAPGSISPDAAGLKLFAEMLHRGFSGIRIEIHDQVCEHQTVATRKTIHAHHTGEIMGKQATGKQVAIHVMDFVKLENGQYTDHWGQNNLAAVIQQL